MTTSRANTIEINDGRKQRSVRSRARIVDALFRLVRGGNFVPRAAEIAAASGVSLRTVFRHIDDMDTLYGDMARQIEAEITPLLCAPYESDNWRDRLDEMIARRAEIYEHVLPIKVSGDLRRYHSDFLMRDHIAFVEAEHDRLHEILPASVSKDAVLMSALHMALSFQSWRRLRQDQKLSAHDARRTMEFTTTRLIGDTTT